MPKYLQLCSVQQVDYKFVSPRIGELEIHWHNFKFKNHMKFLIFVERPVLLYLLARVFCLVPFCTWILVDLQLPMKMKWFGYICPTWRLFYGAYDFSILCMELRGRWGYKKEGMLFFEERTNFNSIQRCSTAVYPHLLTVCLPCYEIWYLKVTLNCHSVNPIFRSGLGFLCYYSLEVFTYG